MSHDFLQRIAPYREVAQTHLGANLKSPLSTVREVGGYILQSGGKRLRPILFLLSVRLCGQNSRLDRYSSIFEFLHCASLLHDDVVDEAKTRRSKAAAHQLWDNPTAILVGDHMFARSLSLAAEAESPRIITILAECIARLAEGQVLELIHQNDLETGLDTYLEIITAKTAALLSASCQVGAVLAGAGAEREAALRSFGLELGIAFQVIDDLLDWAGDEAVVGKPVGQDLKEGKATLPWILALERATGETRRRMTEIAGRDYAPMEWDWLKTTVRELGGLDATLGRAEEYKDRAKGRLDLFPPSEERSLLLELADYVCRRRY